jgi:hypothetical protein
MRPSARHERSQLLQILLSLTVRQFFSVSAYFFPTPTLADANVLRTPMFGGHLVFHAPMFCRRLGFVCTNVLSTPKFCGRLYFSCILPAPIF